MTTRAVDNAEGYDDDRPPENPPGHEGHCLEEWTPASGERRSVICHDCNRMFVTLPGESRWWEVE